MRTCCLILGFDYPYVGHRQHHLQLIFAIIHKRTTDKRPKNRDVMNRPQYNTCDLLAAEYFSENTTRSPNYNSDTKIDVCSANFQYNTFA